MKFIKKPLGCLVTFLVSLVAVVALLFVGGVYLLNNFAGDVVGKQLTARTGFPVAMAPAQVSVLDGLVDFTDIKITNPERFPDPAFVTLNQLKAKVDPWSLLGERVVVEEAVVDLANLTVVQPKEGDSNLSVFSAAFIGESGKSAPGTAPAPGQTESPGRPYIIKTLTIRIGTVNYVNFKSGDAKTQTFPINYERTFHDVTNVNDLWVEIGKDLAVKGLTFAAAAIFDTLLNTETYKGAVNTFMETTGKTIQGLKGAVEGAIEGAGGFFQNIFN